MDKKMLLGLLKELIRGFLGNVVWCNGGIKSQFLRHIVSFSGFVVIFIAVQMFLFVRFVCLTT